MWSGRALLSTGLFPLGENRDQGVLAVAIRQSSNWHKTAHAPELISDGDLPLSGGLESSPLFSNMARRFLTWLMVTIAGVIALQQQIGRNAGGGYRIERRAEKSTRPSTSWFP